jgi:Fe-S oxidoreductase
LQSVQFNTLVSTCPHCIHTIKHEYPEFGVIGDGNTRVIHHTELLMDLMKEKRLDFESYEKSVTYHDPCYLGRYQKSYTTPRELLNIVSGEKMLEMAHHKKSSMCCGGGGGHFWMDINEGERINVLRYKEAVDTGAQTLVTACPFCLQMMEDAEKVIPSSIPSMEIKDIVEILVT